MKAAIYSRKSKFTGKGESVENQIQLCKEHGMKYLGLSEDDFTIYEDEGFSGGNTNRPQFQRLIKDAKARKFDILICYRLDRISRNVSDFSQLERETIAERIKDNAIPSLRKHSGARTATLCWKVSLIASDYGTTIRDFRKKHKLTHKKFGVLIGMHPKVPARWEKGKSKPTRVSYEKN